MFYTTKNIISDYLIEESERAVLLFGGDSKLDIWIDFEARCEFF